MKIEVGKIYRCGPRYVRIVGKIMQFQNLDANPPLDLTKSNAGYIGVEWLLGQSVVAPAYYMGRFFIDGIYTNSNCEELRHDLEELKEKEKEEMTLEEVCEELGRKIKIVSQ